jgi:aminoglycoside 6'-N-acetyltransferase
MLERWLATPEAVRWWGDPLEEITLIRDDFNNPDMRQWIVSCDGKPFAYAQAYDVSIWPQPHLAQLPRGTMAIDTFIGVSDMIGRGHGGRYLRRIAESLIEEGAPCIAIDPDADNLRAHKAYRNAGFRDKSLVETEVGPALLMIFSGGHSD